jgi:hypothetical protein
LRRAVVTCAADVEGAAAPLDLHEGIRDPLAGRCARWPEHLRLLNHSTGELLPGRCRATNLCRYCQKLYVVETVEMLAIDACEYAPTLWAVLTAREHLTRAECRRHLAQLLRAARKRWGGIQWFVQVEFQRRGALHLNLLVKGVPIADADELHEVLSRVWCSRVDALPVGQWVGEIADAEGVVKYLSKMLAHGLKAEQAPPIGWRGHRTSQTRGYLVRPASELRVEARRALRVKRLLHRGLDLEDAEHELAIAELTTWSLRYVNPSTIEIRPERREGRAASAHEEGHDAPEPRRKPGSHSGRGSRPPFTSTTHLPSRRERPEVWAPAQTGTALRPVGG